MRNLSWLQTCISIVLFFLGINGVRIQRAVRFFDDSNDSKNRFVIVSVVKERGREEG